MSEAADRFRLSYERKLSAMNRTVKIIRLTSFLKSTRTSASHKSAIKDKIYELKHRKKRKRKLPVISEFCPGSKPVETDQANSIHEVNRNFDCIRYDKCLDFAYRSKWKGFSCSECEFNKMESDKNA